MNRVSDLRDLCQLWADDVAAFEEQGRIDRVTADALARFARSFFSGLVSVAGVRRLVPGAAVPFSALGVSASPSGSSNGSTPLSTGRRGFPGFSWDASTGKTEGPQEKKSVVACVQSVEPENKAKTENSLDLWNFAETENARKNRL